MEQVNNDPHLKEYETFSEFSKEQGSAFKTTMFGFDKEDVISYIDRLVRDVTDQKNSLEEAHIRLTDQNRDLVDRINKYEQHISLLRKQLDDEKQFNENAREREELFKKAVGVLQEKVTYLQGNTTNKELEESFNTQMQKANDIVMRLREELLTKDNSIRKMNDEIGRRNEILLNQDKLMSMKDKQIEYYTINQEKLKQKINEQTDITDRMSEQITSMKDRISSLESKLRDATIEIASNNRNAQSERYNENASYRYNSPVGNTDIPIYSNTGYKNEEMGKEQNPYNQYTADRYQLRNDVNPHTTSDDFSEFMRRNQTYQNEYTGPSQYTEEPIYERPYIPETKRKSYDDYGIDLNHNPNGNYYRGNPNGSL